MKSDIKTKDIEKRVKQIISEHTGILTKNIKLNSDLRVDLGIDSFAAIELIFSLKEEFGLNIEDSELQKLKTVNDILQAIKSKI